MNEKDILKSIKSSIDNAPIDLLEDIKAQPRVKMLKHDEITRQQSRKSHMKSLVSYASVAAVFLVVLLNWQLNYRMTSSSIYLDVNPSINIETNKKEKVISLQAGNIDGQKIIEGIDYKGGSVYSITEEILHNMMQENYISESEEFVLLAVYNKNEEKAKIQKEKLDQIIHQYLENNSINPIVLTQDFNKNKTIEKHSNEYGVSLSKMAFIKNLMDLDPDLQVENLVKLSIRQLVNLSQEMKLELDKIIESKDFQRIKSIYADDDDDYDDDDYDDDDYDDDDYDDDEDNDDYDDDEDDDDYDKEDYDDNEYDDDKYDDDDEDQDEDDDEEEDEENDRDDIADDEDQENDDEDE